MIENLNDFDTAGANFLAESARWDREVERMNRIGFDFKTHPPIPPCPYFDGHVFQMPTASFADWRPIIALVAENWWRREAERLADEEEFNNVLDHTAFRGSHAQRAGVARMGGAEMKIKPCPFCGGKVVKVGLGLWCEKCWVCFSAPELSPENALIESFNRRANARKAKVKK